MSTIKLDDKSDLKLLREELATALGAVEASLGVTITLGTFRYGPDEVRIQASVTQEGLDAHAVAFKRHAADFDLKGADLGAEVTLNGRKCRLVGIKPKSRKYPILVERVSDGKRFKFPASSVLKALDRKVPSWMAMMESR